MDTTSPTSLDAARMTRAQRAALPISADVTQILAEQYGVCIRPLAMRRIDTTTGRIDIVPDRGRDRPRGRPPAQIPACAANALGSCLGYERRSVHPGRDAECGRVVAIVSPGGSSDPSSGDDAGCDYVTPLTSA
jgi:hypothetical protein